jgi:hypothetical protein
MSVLATALTLGTGTARAATCSVPSVAYPTIQAAVNAAGCSTITVDPGLYTENVSIGRTLTLRGARAGHNVAGRTAGGPLESTVKGASSAGPTITINAPTVTIDGFTVRNIVTTFDANGIQVKAGGNGALIQNNIIDTVTTADTGLNGAAQGIYLESGPDNVQILKNRINNVQSTRSAKGILIGVNGGTNPSQNTLIRGNTIANITSATKGGYGVSVANTPGVSGLKILNNTINGLNGGGWVHAIGLEGDTPNVRVEHNNISNLTAPGAAFRKVAVWFESNPSFSTGQVHNNNFNLTAASFGIAVDPALSGSPVHGTCNWWGSPSGPTNAGNPGGTGAQAGPNVTYAPWLAERAPGGDCGDHQGNDNGDHHGDDNGDHGGNHEGDD